MASVVASTRSSKRMSSKRASVNKDRTSTSSKRASTKSKRSSKRTSTKQESTKPESAHARHRSYAGKGYVEAKRKPIINRPSGHYSDLRLEHNTSEDLELVDNFAMWLTAITKLPVSPSHEKFCSDLSDGMALCHLMSLLEGSGVRTWHDVRSPELATMREFYGRENLVNFQRGCQRLGLPVVFSVSDIKKNRLSTVVSCLVYVAIVAVEQKLRAKDKHGSVVSIPDEIMERVEEILKDESNKSLLPEDNRDKEAYGEMSTWDKIVAWARGLAVQMGCAKENRDEE